MNNGGDVLARGGQKAQFGTSSGDVSDFEYDMKLRRDLVKGKYGLSDAEIEEYAEKMDNGERFDLKSVDEIVDLAKEAGISVVDKRANFFDALNAKEESKPAPKFAEKKYSLFSPVLDRILVKRCAEDSELKIMEDGSVVNVRTGLITTAKYRQHSNIGIVLATGKFVIIGGQIIPMSDVVKVGDRVTYGDYNSEVFRMDEKRVMALCDAVQMNYEKDEEGLRIVRVQDVRGVESPEVDNV